MKTLLIQALLVFLAFGLKAQTATPPAGLGTQADPYQIETWENLYWVSQNETSWTSYFVQTANIEFPSDIDAWDGGSGWTPIGNGTASVQGNQTTITGQNFLGDYNGQYYTITGLYINRPGENNVGLFGHVGDPNVADGINTNIYNVRLIDSEVTGARGVGSLAGRITGNQNTMIERSSSDGGTVTGKSVTGGLVGANNGDRAAPGLEDDTNPVISQSWTNIAVVYSGVQGNPTEKFGGLTGCNQKGTILDSYARGPVTVDNSGNSWTVERIGGLAGCIEQRGLVQRSYSTGLVAVDGNVDLDLVGGLIGNLDGTGQGNLGIVEDSYWDIQTSDQTTSAEGINVEGKDTDDMIYPYDLNDVYVGWDFTSIWKQDDEEPKINDGYPYLAWQLIEPAAPTQLAFVDQPQNTVAGESIPDVTVEILDINEERVESYTGIIDISLENDPTSDAGLFGTLTVSAVDGLAIFSGLIIQVAAEGYTLSAVDESGEFVSVISDPFDILAAEVDAGESSVATTSPHTADGSDASTVTITLKDEFGNTIAGFTDDDFDLGVGGNAIAGNFVEVGGGEYTYQVTNTVAETINVVVTAGGVELTDQPEIVFEAGPVDADESLVVATSPHTADGSDFSLVTITLFDAFENPIAGLEDADFDLGLGGNAIAGSFSEVGGGQYTYQVTNTVAETINVVVTAGGVELDDQPEVVFEAGDADAGESIVEADPETGVVADGNDSSTITVTLFDENGNALLAGGDDVFLETDLGDLGAITDNQDGTYQASLTSTEAGDAEVTAYLGEDSQGDLIGSVTVEFITGSPSQLVFTEQPQDAVAGEQIGNPYVVVEIQDAFGNRVTSFDDEVSVALNNAGNAELSGLAAVDAIEGIATFSDLSVDLVGTYTLKATGAQLETDSDAFNILPGEPVAMESSIEADPEENVLADEEDKSIITVTLRDTFGNYVPDAGEIVLLFISGVGETNNYSNNGDGTYTWDLTSDSPGTSSVTAILTSGVDEGPSPQGVPGDPLVGDEIGQVSVSFICPELSGVVSYYKHNDANYPLAGFHVRLLDDQEEVIAETATDVQGMYTFDDPGALINATWIEVESILPHGGMSAIDALAIQRTVAGLPVAYWEPEGFITHVGDVGDNGLNTTDAARVQFRSIFPDNPFDAGEWAFYSPGDEVLFDNVDNRENPSGHSFTARRAYDPTLCEIDIVARAYGDVRGSYNFSIATKASEESIHSDEVTQVEPGKVFTLPLTVDRDIEFAAMRLDIPYNSSKVEVLDVISEIPGLIHTIEDGSIQVSWFDLSPTFVSRGEAILYLELQTVDAVSAEDMIFFKGEDTEFGDVSAEPILDFGLKISRIDNDISTGIAEEPVKALDLSVFPNPFRDQLQVEYTLDRPAHVRVTIINAMGATVSEMVNTGQSAGNHSHVYHPQTANYRPGVYFLRIEIADDNKRTVETRRILFHR